MNITENIHNVTKVSVRTHWVRDEFQVCELVIETEGFRKEIACFLETAVAEVPPDFGDVRRKWDRVYREIICDPEGVGIMEVMSAPDDGEEQ